VCVCDLVTASRYWSKLDMDSQELILTYLTMGTVIQQLLLLVPNYEWWSFDDREVYSPDRFRPDDFVVVGRRRPTSFGRNGDLPD
jgi:hypothetical protein